MVSGKPRILIIMLLSSLDFKTSYGGVDTVCQSHLSGLIDVPSERFEFKILAFSPANDLPVAGKKLEISDNVSLEWHNLSFKRRGGLRGKIPNFVQQQACVWAAIRKHRPDIVQSHIPHLPLFAYFGAKKILTLHSWGKIGRKDFGALNNFLHERLLQPLSLMTTHSITTVSREIVDLLTSKSKSRSISYVPNPVQKAFFEIPATKVRAGASSIVVVGNINPRKRTLDCLRALEIVRNSGCDATLKFVGPFSESNAYYHEVTSFVVDRGLSDFVEFVGRVSIPELIRHIDECHVALSMSEDETFGLAPLEVLARGRPVVATAVGVMDWDRSILEGRGAHIVDIGNYKGAASALIECLKQANPPVDRRIVSSSYATVPYIGRYEDVYDDLLSS